MQYATYVCQRWPLVGKFMQDQFIKRKLGESLSTNMDVSSVFSDTVQDLDRAKEELERNYSLGKIFYDKADLGLAEEHFKKALQYVQIPRDIFVQFKILGFLIRICHERMDSSCVTELVDKSEQLIEQAARQLGFLSGEYFYNCGMIKSYHLDYSASKDILEIAIKQAKIENDYELQAKCLLALAKANFHLKNFDSALDYINHLTQLLAVIDKSYLCGSMYLLSGNIYLDLDQYEKAEKFFQMACVHLRGKHCWNLIGYIYVSRGKIYKKKGEYGTALTYFNLAKDVTDTKVFKRLTLLVQSEIEDVTDSNVDIYLDRVNRKIVERTLGTIDFKHRFVLLEILFLLANNVGTYFDKDVLAKRIWKDNYNPLIHDKLIYTSISRLRKLIEPPKGGTKRRYIVRGKDGYTFCSSRKVRFYLEDNSFNAASTLSDLEIGSPI